MPFSFKVLPSTVAVSGSVTPATSPARAGVTIARQRIPASTFRIDLPSLRSLLWPDLRRVPRPRQIHDLADQVRIAATRLLRGHGELRGRREPGVRVCFDDEHLSFLRQPHVDPPVVA